jgi:hypothetical protein
VICDKLLSRSANPDISRLFCDLLAEDVKSAFLISGTKGRKPVDRAFLRMKNDQDTSLPLKPGGLIMVPPDKQVGESELRDPGRVFAQELVKQRLVLDLYWFEISHRRSRPKNSPLWKRGGRRLSGKSDR